MKQEKPCIKCADNAFDSLAELQSHFQNLHQVNVNIRDIVVKSASQDIEISQESFICTLCEDRPAFISDEKRIKHVNDVHVPAKMAQLQCPLCLQHFKNPSSFRKHQAEHYKGNVFKRVSRVYIGSNDSNGYTISHVLTSENLEHDAERSYVKHVSTTGPIF